jgi:hypothetical protein
VSSSSSALLVFYSWCCIDRKVLERESRQWKEREDRAKSAVQQNRQSAALWESRVADSELARQQSEDKFLTVIADADRARQRHLEAQQKQQDSAAPTWYHQWCLCMTPFHW